MTRGWAIWKSPEARSGRLRPKASFPLSLSDNALTCSRSDEGSDSSPEQLPPRAKLPKVVRRDSGSFEKFAREAFDLCVALSSPLSLLELTTSPRSFWEMYAPLAPYIVPTSDRYEQVKDQSPGLMHCIVYVLVHLSFFPPCAS